MNQLPIELTLYYPTAAQFEAYLGFMAMLSIAASLVILSFPLWLWCARKTISRENSIMSLVFSLNPAGCAAVIITDSDLGSGVSYLADTTGLCKPFMRGLFVTKDYISLLAGSRGCGYYLDIN